jgi:predicted nucleic acid-binding protein
VTDPALMSLPDGLILAHAATAGRALVTANIKDFMPLDAQYRDSALLDGPP